MPTTPRRRRTSTGSPPRTYIGRNARGAELRISGSDTDAAFDPGELLHLALAACGLLSADHTLQSRLGEDFVAHAEVAATKSDDGSRYEAITADIVVGMDGLDDAKRQALTERSLRAVERLCTVSQSLADGVDCQVRVRHGAATA